ncbi:unnamed protein product [Heligmosomoides polygyrus]|uniref:E3 ubiquitin-protein ligase n=1 Tax=Heligmosomoides polygyrus TaxID=6339 RepID=A0A183G0X0_HELPZ|nr:unnamed protein product [Heligmosomoides polygyrus]
MANNFREENMEEMRARRRNFVLMCAGARFPDVNPDDLSPLVDECEDQEAEAEYHTSSDENEERSRNSRIFGTPTGEESFVSRDSRIFGTSTEEEGVDTSMNEIATEGKNDKASKISRISGTRTDNEHEDEDQDQSESEGGDCTRCPGGDLIPSECL